MKNVIQRPERNILWRERARATCSLLFERSGTGRIRVLPSTIDLNDYAREVRAKAELDYY